MEWFSKVGEAAKWIADKLGDGLEAVFDTIGLDFVGDGINWLTDRVGEKVQAVIEREKSFIEGAGGKLEDLFSENLWEDFGGWLATNTGNALDRLGTDLETIADSFKINTRTLTNRELEVAKSVFGDSINYDLIRIDEWSFSGLINDWENHNRPYTTFHTINSWAPMDDATLIHELTHVWQYEQFGSVYISKAIAGQLENPLPGIYPEHIANNNDPKGYGGYQNGYGYGGYTELQDRMDLGQGLGSYNFEQQAEIIKHYFQMREDNYTVNDFHLPLYSHFVKEVSSLPLTTLYPLHVIGSTGDDKIYGNNTNNGIDGGLGNDTLKSWNGNDTLIGGWGNDSLYGDGGNDSLYGGGDDDYHDGGDGDDLIAGWNGNDTLDGGGGSDSLYGDGGNDYLHGQAGDDTLDGGGGNDYLYSHSGNDILDGQAGDDIILGGDGNDFLYGGEDNDIIYGTAFPDPDGVSVSYLNNDNLFGQEGDDKLYGSDGDDYIDGGSNYDRLYGREGNDILIGGSGDDILTGSNPDVWNSGADEFDNLTGDAGADIFVLGDSSEAYYRGLASAEILDFNWNEGDKIRVFGSASNYSLSHTQMGDDVNPTPVDTAIIYQDDVIGVVHDTMDVFISRDFIFV